MNGTQSICAADLVASSRHSFVPSRTSATHESFEQALNGRSSSAGGSPSKPDASATLLPCATKTQDGLLPGGRWDVALLLEIHFTLEQGGFGARMVLLLPDAAIRGMKEALDHFLEAL